MSKGRRIGFRDGVVTVPYDEGRTAVVCVGEADHSLPGISQKCHAVGIIIWQCGSGIGFGERVLRRRRFAAAQDDNLLTIAR